jgi:predicted RND superfamily exporter protein
MKSKRFCSFLVLLMISLAVSFGGCSREVQQRQAFTSFLQKEVIPRNSGILIPNKAVRKKFGIYATHYDVIVEYNKVMLEKILRPMEKLQREYQDTVKPEASVEERRSAIIKYREALQAIEATLDKELATTESEVAKLDQPEELKNVYTMAVDKHVRLPAKAFKAMIPATEKMMSKNLIPSRANLI